MKQNRKLLAAWIDEFGLDAVLDMISDICMAKADRIRKNWRPPNSLEVRLPGRWPMIITLGDGDVKQMTITRARALVKEALRGQGLKLSHVAREDIDNAARRLIENWKEWDKREKVDDQG